MTYPKDKDYKKLNPDKAMCHACGHIQEAKKGFDCEKCGLDTFTKKGWFDLKEASKGSFTEVFDI